MEELLTSDMVLEYRIAELEQQLSTVTSERDELLLHKTAALQLIHKASSVRTEGFNEGIGAAAEVCDELAEIILVVGKGSDIKLEYAGCSNQCELLAKEIRALKREVE